jgi:ABC-type sugar transport system substrate-binding protein
MKHISTSLRPWRIIKARTKKQEEFPMKRVLVTLIALVMTAALPCASSAADKPMRIMLSNAYYTAPFCAAYNKAAMEEAQALGYELTILDGAGNQQTQLAQANQAVAEKFDGFMYFPADVEGAKPVIEALNAGGIPWVGVNAYPGNQAEADGMKYYVGADAASHGQSMAEALLKMFPDGANLVGIEGTAGHMQTIEINKVLAADLNDKYVWLDRQDCNFQAEVAMTKMTDMLTAYGVKSKGGKIDCIVCHDGGMLTGVMSALQAAGLQPGDVSIVAVGSNHVLGDALADGWLTACSTQDPVAEAKLAVETLDKVIKGTATPGWTRLPTPVATKETMDQFNWF